MLPLRYALRCRLLILSRCRGAALISRAATPCRFRLMLPRHAAVRYATLILICLFSPLRHIFAAIWPMMF